MSWDAAAACPPRLGDTFALLSGRPPLPAWAAPAALALAGAGCLALAAAEIRRRKAPAAVPAASEEGAKGSGEAARGARGGSGEWEDLGVVDTPVVIVTKLVDGGKWINQYTKVRRLGAGSHGNVSLYRCTRSGGHYAIKSVNKAARGKRRLSHAPTLLDGVRQGVAAMRAARHSRVVSLHEVIDDPEHDKMYLVMEHVEGGGGGGGGGVAGGDPSTRLPVAGGGAGAGSAGAAGGGVWTAAAGGGSADTCVSRRLPETEGKSVAADLLQGIRYLHSVSVVHGDLKPGNVLIAPSGRAKIVDLTSARVTEDEAGTLSRAPATLAFAPPEALAGGSYGGKAADMWAAGLTLHQLLSGRFPFPLGGGDDAEAILRSIESTKLARPEGMSPGAWDLVARLLKPDPKARLTAAGACGHPWLAGRVSTESGGASR